VPKIIEFYLCIQTLPAKCKWLHFSWATLYITKSVQMSEDTNNPVYKLTTDNLQLLLINVLIRSISEQ